VIFTFALNSQHLQLTDSTISAYSIRVGKGNLK